MRIRPALVPVVVLVAAAFLVFVPLFRHFFDLGVYRGAVHSFLFEGGDLYAFRYRGTGYGFTYPPFAALVLSPLALLSWPVAVAASLLINAGAVAWLVRWWMPGALLVLLPHGPARSPTAAAIRPSSTGSGKAPAEVTTIAE